MKKLKKVKKDSILQEMELYVIWDENAGTMEREDNSLFVKVNPNWWNKLSFDEKMHYLQEYWLFRNRHTMGEYK